MTTSGPAPTLDPRAATLIEQLGLAPHPEGGYYRELFRSPLAVQPGDERPARRALTTIYFLLPAGEHSRWHQVRSDEVWHLYEGGPIELLVSPPGFPTVERVLLGPPGTTLGPCHTVPAGWWQAARPRGAYALAGCTVAPGFEFADFRFVREAPEELARLHALSPELARLA